MRRHKTVAISLCAVVLAVSAFFVGIRPSRANELPVGTYFDSLYENGIPVSRVHVNSIVPMKEIIIRWNKSANIHPRVVVLKGDLGTSVVRDYPNTLITSNWSPPYLTISVYTSNGKHYLI